MHVKKNWEKAKDLLSKDRQVIFCMSYLRARSLSVLLERPNCFEQYRAPFSKFIIMYVFSTNINMYVGMSMYILEFFDFILW